MVLYTLGSRPVQEAKPEELIYVDKIALEAYNIFATAREKDALYGYATSFYTVEGHIKSINEYGRPHMPEPSTPEWQQTKDHVKNMFKGFTKVSAIPSNQFDRVSYVSSSAAGFGYTGKKGDPGNYEKARSIASSIAHSVKEGNTVEQVINSTPDLAFSRTQLTPYLLKEKIRNVWGEAFHTFMLEALYAQPVVDYFIRVDEFYYIGKDPLKRVPITIEEYLKKFCTIYSVDWSGFDASAQAYEIRFAFECIEEMIIFAPSDRKAIFDYLIEVFIFRKVIRPDGIEVVKDLGVPSGSAFTNLIDSIINYTRIQFIWKSLTGNFVEMKVQGDDSFIGVTERQVIPSIEIDNFCRPYGWKVNWTKTEVCHRAKLPSFLARTIKQGQMYREELELLRKFVYPEYEITDPQISALRGMSLWKDGNMSCNTLHQCWRYLARKHGIAQELPSNLKLHRI